MLSIAVAVVFLAIVLQVRPDQRVAFRPLANFPVPGLCLSQSWFGIACPGCGLTRSFIYLAHGDWQAAWKVHRLGWLVASTTVFQIPYRSACLASRERWRLPNYLTDGFGWLLIVLLIANWLIGFVANIGE